MPKQPGMVRPKPTATKSAPAVRAAPRAEKVAPWRVKKEKEKALKEEGLLHRPSPSSSSSSSEAERRALEMALEVQAAEFKAADLKRKLQFRNLVAQLLQEDGQVPLGKPAVLTTPPGKW